MSASAVAPHGLLLPPRSGGVGGPGAALSLLAHAALVAALAWGVQWRMGEPTVLSAELWAAVPQQAAPPPAPPPPTPPAAQPPAPPLAAEPATPKAAEPDAQIAVERQRREAREQEQRARAEAEKARREREARDKAERDKAEREKEQREARAQDERVARQREENIRRMLGAAGAGSAPSATGTAARDAAPSAAYAGRLRARIRPNIVFADEARGNPEAEVEVRCAPEGTILGRRILKSSGQKAWDDAVLRAIDKTERLPPDVDGRVPSVLIVAFRLRE